MFRLTITFTFQLSQLTLSLSLSRQAVVAGRCLAFSPPAHERLHFIARRVQHYHQHCSSLFLGFCDNARYINSAFHNEKSAHKVHFFCFNLLRFDALPSYARKIRGSPLLLDHRREIFSCYHKRGWYFLLAFLWHSFAIPSDSFRRRRLDTRINGLESKSEVRQNHQNRDVTPNGRKLHPQLPAKKMQKLIGNFWQNRLF